MESEVFKKVVELRKLGVATAGMPEAWRKEIAQIVIDGTPIRKVSDATKINITTIESWVKKYADNGVRPRFTELDVVDEDSRSTSFLIKVEVIRSGVSTKFESTGKTELISILKKVL